LFALVLASGCGGPRAPAAPEATAGCEPGRCMDDISGAIAAQRAAARACFDAWAKRDPSLQGQIIIKFEIDATGAVIDASQGMEPDQISDPDVVACVTEVVKRVTFAKSAHGKSSRAFHRFEFSPR
jgi:hypothetical protein